VEDGLGCESNMPRKDSTTGGAGDEGGRDHVVKEKVAKIEDALKPTLQVPRENDSDSDNDEFKDAASSPQPTPPQPMTPRPEVQEVKKAADLEEAKPESIIAEPTESENQAPSNLASKLQSPKYLPSEDTAEALPEQKIPITATKDPIPEPSLPPTKTNALGQSSNANGVSEWSHQQMAPKVAQEEKAEADEWQVMPAYAPYDIYDDDNKLIAREQAESDDEAAAYSGLGGAGKGYTRVQLDEDAQSATSLDENTQYLFREINNTGAGHEDDDDQRDAVSQLQATKDLLTEGQRIAYVGMTRLALSAMLREAQLLETLSKGTKKKHSSGGRGNVNVEPENDGPHIYTYGH